jgi:hypothetical protein
MSKVEKIWLWISVAMFAIPEILFFTSSALITSINGGNLYEFSSLVVNYKFFVRYPIYLLVIIVIEFLGILSLLVFSAKKKKILLAILLLLVLIWLFFIFAIVYVTGIKMSF